MEFLQFKVLLKCYGPVNMQMLCMFYSHQFNSPVLHSARHQRPVRERHKIGIALRENFDNKMPRNTNFTH